MSKISSKRRKVYLYGIIKKLLFIIPLIVFIYYLSQNGISNIKDNIESYGIWAPLILFILRSTSIVIPALPGTAYSVLAGTLFGFKQGVVIICLADIASCSISFLISRYYGRNIVRKIVGNKFIKKIEDLSQRHLENNFFLMTGFLMTGLFDFVCYAIGLTKTPWKKFAPALLISILISNPPIVALGAGLLAGGNKLIIIALFLIFILAIISGKIRKSNYI